MNNKLPIPTHFNPAKVSEIWRVPYQQRSMEAEVWTKQHNIKPAAEDASRVCLLLIDVILSIKNIFYIYFILFFVFTAVFLH